MKCIKLFLYKIGIRRKSYDDEFLDQLRNILKGRPGFEELEGKKKKIADEIRIRIEKVDNK